MALSTDIYTILRANSDVVNAMATRIYPVIAPEKVTLPCIVYTLTSVTPTETKQSSMYWDECYVTVTAIAKTLTLAETYGNNIRTAMSRYEGTIGSDVVKGVNMIGQDWEAVPIMEEGTSTGVTVFAVNSQFKIMVKQNISE